MLSAAENALKFPDRSVGNSRSVDISFQLLVSFLSNYNFFLFSSIMFYVYLSVFPQILLACSFLFPFFPFLSFVFVVFVFFFYFEQVATGLKFVTSLFRVFLRCSYLISSAIREKEFVLIFSLVLSICLLVFGLSLSQMNV